MATRTGSKALSCRVTVTLSAAARKFIESLATNPAILPYPARGTQSFDVLVNDDAGRITHLSEEGKSRWTVVRRAGTRAASTWDHTNATALDFEADDLVKTHIRPAGAVKLEISTEAQTSASRAAIQEGSPQT